MGASGDDTEEEGGEGDQTGGEGNHPRDDDEAVALQQERLASHAHASSQDADTAMVPVTQGGGSHLAPPSGVSPLGPL